MGYSENMKQLLSPLRIYDLEAGYGVNELDAVGAVLDELYEQLLVIERESVVPTAEDEGLSAYESILPYLPSSEKLEERRSSICAFLRIDGASFTPEEIQNTIIGCGANAFVSETDRSDTAEISFPGKRGIPDGIEELKVRIESILPCHLNVVYVYVYPTWEELEAAFDTWGDIERAGMTWDMMEKVGEETV